MNFPAAAESILSPVRCPGIQLYLKRDDLLHPVVSGNKWRKLGPYIRQARQENYQGILTFGGAWSNHIHATAFACREAGLLSAGVIRGERPPVLGHTLQDAESWEMQLVFTSRENYRRKAQPGFLHAWQEQYPGFLIVPEGGAGIPGMDGCREIVREIPFPPDYICVPCGTGTTLAGIAAETGPGAKVYGFSALRNGDFLYEENRKWPGMDLSARVRIISAYSGGGYARISPELEHFICDFYREHHILLDPVYTGKMMQGIFDMAGKKLFPEHAVVVAIHTGGIQGLRGYPALLDKLEKIKPTGFP